MGLERKFRGFKGGTYVKRDFGGAEEGIDFWVSIWELWAWCRLQLCHCWITVLRRRRVVEGRCDNCVDDALGVEE